jgi:formylglycine-generating enzyme required for sulfatase activity
MSWSKPTCAVLVLTACSPRSSPPPAAAPAPAPTFSFGTPSTATSAKPAPPQPQPPAPFVDPIAMVAVRGSTFTMGSLEDESARPPQRVTVASFQIHVTEVSAAAYLACVRAGACTPTRAPMDDYCNIGRAGHEQHPANCVTLNQARAYCAAAGKRLPTEPEWELAARGTDGRKYSWGNKVYGPEECRPRDMWATCEVGSAPAGKSPSGALDMTGNVWEWTDTEHCAYGKSGCKSGLFTARGGSSASYVFATATIRAGQAPDEPNESLGFRCARNS